MASGSAIKYQPLVGADEIRLMRLKSCDSDDKSGPVECELEHARRDGAPEYTALSYAWEGGSGQSSILVNGEKVDIGMNLEQALRTLRDHTDTQLLWADQLCINQEDDAEKSSQVRQMKDIYSSSAKVIAWLGAATDTSGAIMDCLSKLKLETDKPEQVEQVIKEYENLEEIAWITDAFDEFCKRTYWRRMWVIQEFAVGKDLFVLWGSTMLWVEPLQTALRAIQRGLLNARHLYTANGQRWPESLTTMNKVWSSTALSFVISLTSRRQKHHAPQNEDARLFFTILVNSLVLEIDYNHPDCTDPRDRIFSVLGLATDAADFEGFPDYSMACEDVFEQAARKFLQKGHIDALAYCQFPRKVRNREIATWAADWHMPTRRPNFGHPYLSHFRASGETKDRQQVEFPNAGSVSLKGVVVDIVEAVADLWDPDWLDDLDPGKVVHYLQEINQLCLNSPRVKKDDLYKSTAMIAVADRLLSEQEGQDRRDIYLGFMSYMYTRNQSLLESGLTEKTAPPDEKEYLYSAYRDGMRFLHARRPFQTRGGYVGLAPDGAAIGNPVVIFLGGKAPYVLRKREPDGYTLVGEAYLDGVMFGELFESDWKEETFILY